MSSHPTLRVATRQLCFERALDGIAHNAAQARIIFDPSPEVDSIVEHLIELDRSATPTQRRTVRALVATIGQLVESNRAEAECQRAIAGALDAEPDEPESAWTYRSLATTLRPHLLTVANPIITGRRDREARTAIANLCASAHHTMLTAVRLRHELGVKPFTTLQGLLADARVAS